MSLSSDTTLFCKTRLCDKTLYSIASLLCDTTLFFITSLSFDTTLFLSRHDVIQPVIQPFFEK